MLLEAIKLSYRLVKYECISTYERGGGGALYVCEIVP